MIVKKEFFCALAALTLCGPANASPDLCQIFKNRKTPTAILLNESGIPTKNSIDLGNLKFSSSLEVEYQRIPTLYKLVVFPRSVFWESSASGSGYVGVEAAKAPCPNTAAFTINLYMNFEKDGVRSYKFNYRFPNVMMEDNPSTPSREANEILDFKPFVFGSITRF